MYVYNDISVATVHESDKKHYTCILMFDATVAAMYISKITGIS